ncbi:MAG: glycosyltransferase family 4 protein [Holophagales bacterium]|nr:MAG: glycosyltransferase family 4 protein [Holophagales bacterium]
MRVAVYSPLPPQRSGIADYTAELMPALAEHHELEFVVEPGWTPAAELDRWRRRAAAELPAALSRGEVDLALYHLGNNAEFHTGIWRTALAAPGVVVLHDFVLHHLVRGMAQDAGDPQLLDRELLRAYGPAGGRAARRARETGAALDPFRWPLFERVVDRSLAVLVHSRFARDRVLRSRPHARIAVVPHHLSLPAAAAMSRAEARQALGLELDVPLVGAFGLMTPVKRPHVLLQALRAVRERLPAARLLVVGEVSPHFHGAAELFAEPGVIVAGRQELDRFLLHMRAVDVAVNLRFPVAGETSGTLVRLLGMGQPVVVTEAGSFAEIPDDCCAKVPLDITEAETLAAVLLALLTDEPLRRTMGDNARRWCGGRHALAASARGYAELLAVVARDPRPPAPELATAALPGVTPTDLWGRVLGRAGRELADLGVDDADDATLLAVSRAAAELGERT